MSTSESSIMHLPLTLKCLLGVVIGAAVLPSPAGGQAGSRTTSPQDGIRLQLGYPGLRDTRLCPPRVSGAEGA